MHTCLNELTALLCLAGSDCMYINIYIHITLPSTYRQISETQHTTAHTHTHNFNQQIQQQPVAQVLCLPTVRTLNVPYRTVSYRTDSAMQLCGEASISSTQYHFT